MQGPSDLHLAFCGFRFECWPAGEREAQRFDIRRTNWYDRCRTIDRRSTMPDTPAPTPKRPPFRRVVVFVPLEQPSA
jgi:hypothetical protein